MLSDYKRFTAVCAWGSRISFCFGLVLWGRINLSEQLVLLGGLTDVCSAVFVILGIWLSVQSIFYYSISGNGKKLRKGGLEKIGSKIPICNFAFCITVTVTVGTLVLRFLLTLCNDLHCGLVLSVFRILGDAFLCMLLFQLVAALVASAFLVLAGFHDYFLYQNKEEVIRQIFSRQSSEGN